MEINFQIKKMLTFVLASVIILGAGELLFKVNTMIKSNPSADKNTVVYQLGASMVDPSNINLFTQSGATIIWPGKPFEWKTVDKGNNKYDFSVYDKDVQALSSKSQIIGRIVTGSCWENVLSMPGCIQYSARPFDMPKDSKSFHAFVKATAKHYKNQINNWQLLDETAIAFEGTSIQMINLQKEFYHAIKEGNPTAQVLPASMPTTLMSGAIIQDEMVHNQAPLALQNYNDIFVPSLPKTYPELNESGLRLLLTKDPYAKYINFTALFIKSGLQYSDVISIHDYANYATAAPLIKEVDLIKKAINKPFIMLTGVANDPGVTPAQQAQAVIKRSLVAYAADAQAVLWWNFADLPSGADNPTNQRAGLLTSQNQPKPAYLAFKQLGQILPNVTQIEQIPADNIYLYRLSKGKSNTFVAWADQPKTVDLSQQIGAANALITPTINQVSQTAVKEQTLSTNQIQLTENPIFITPTAK